MAGADSVMSSAGEGNRGARHLSRGQRGACWRMRKEWRQDQKGRMAGGHVWTKRIDFTHSCNCHRSRRDTDARPGSQAAPELGGHPQPFPTCSLRLAVCSQLQRQQPLWSKKHHFRGCFVPDSLLQKPVLEKPSTALRELENSGLSRWRAQRS